MTDLQEHYKNLLSSLNLKNAKEITDAQTNCTLLDDNDDVAVEIELPDNSDLLLLHRKISALPDEPELRSARMLQLLAVNGNPERLRGAWFCIDEEAIDIHLMTSYPVKSIDKIEFNNLLSNFITLADTLGQELQEEIQEAQQSGSLSPMGIIP